MRMTRTSALAAASLLALSACHKPNKTTDSTTRTSTTTTAQNASASATAGGIDGTWKTDLSTLQVEQKPDQFMLKAGQFSCLTCTPPLTVAADGAPHAVTGRPYADQISVKTDDDHNVTRINQKGGKTTGTTKYTVSADGNTLTVSFNDTSGSKPVTGSYTETRVDSAPAGAHLISGSWKQSKYNNVSDEGLTVTFKVDGDMMHMTTPTGQSFDAKLDGSEVPIKGDIGGTTASVKKTGTDTYVETDKRGGKIVGVTTMTLGGDGKLSVFGEDKQAGSTSKFLMSKQ